MFATLSFIAMQRMDRPVWSEISDSTDSGGARSESGFSRSLASFALGQTQRTEVQAANATLDAADLELIRQQPFCVASGVWSFGKISEVVRFVGRRDGDQLRVGYFVHWSAERPWGNNMLTYTLLPALTLDLVYSHFLFVLPGLREAAYGASDVEGVSVTYAAQGDGLRVLHGDADDGVHTPIQLDAEELTTPDQRVVVMSEVWSHQLGARRASQRLDSAASLTCFSGRRLQPLTRELARGFRLGSVEHPRRARPAWRALTLPE
ncbi:MAG TPA: hypothetical protein VFQ61_27785 [Polyangiaceae bacterium]|nr:hypothetical protein [Polyangiaceae bacterium]